MNIPDANFKNALLNEAVVDTDGDRWGDIDADTNNDGEIQISEAQAVVGLIITDKNIASLEGLEYFVNLEVLLCRKNSIHTMDVTNLQYLTELWCDENQLTELDVTQNTYLQWLLCDRNQLILLTFQKIHILNILASSLIK